MDGEKLPSPNESGTGKAGETENANSTGAAVEASQPVTTATCPEKTSTSQNVSLPDNLIQKMSQTNSGKPTSSTGGGNGGSGNSSDGNNSNNSRESGFSLGNNSFGFNFDSDSSPINSDADGKVRYENEAVFDAKTEDGEKNSQPTPTTSQKLPQTQPQSQSQPPSSSSMAVTTGSVPAAPKPDSAKLSAAVPAVPAMTSTTTTITNNNSATSATTNTSTVVASASLQPQVYPSASITPGISNEDAATVAVSNLQSIASKSVAFLTDPNNNRFLKRKADSSISAITVSSDAQSVSSSYADSLNPLSTDASFVGSSVKLEQTSSGGPKQKKKKAMDESKREERNAREKERSYRIASQINELRNLLSTGGVIVPKGTKNAVLTEAANYIRMLQQHQYKSEIHRQQLIQQMQVIGSGALGPQAAQAIRHVAAQNGVWSLGNFGGIAPRTAMTPFQPDQQQSQNQDGQNAAFGSTNKTADGSNQGDQIDSPLLKSIEENDYRFVFNSCSVPMAIASMGGAFIDCNALFTQLSDYTKQEICSLTIFNLTSRSDLQHAFDLVSQMISPPADGQSDVAPQCILRGNMKNKSDLGLNISLIKDDDGIAKCFCVTLIQNPSAPFDTSRPATMQQQQVNGSKTGNMSSPAFMTG